MNNDLRDELAIKEGSPYHETSEARVIAFKNGWDACLAHQSPVAEITLPDIVEILKQCENDHTRSVGIGCNYEKYILPSDYRLIARKVISMIRQKATPQPVPLDEKRLNPFNIDFSFLAWDEKDLKQDDWVVTNDKVFGCEVQGFKIFQFDERINYSIHFGHKYKFYRLSTPIATETPAAPQPVYPVTDKIKKYEKYISNLEWHIKTNKPEENEVKELAVRINDFREIISDLKSLSGDKENGGGDEMLEEMVNMVWDWSNDNGGSQSGRDATMNYMKLHYDVRKR